MAEWHVYRCRKCGYEVHTEPQGFYALFSGQYYNFKCKKCKNIVSISSSELERMSYRPQCPECGDTKHLSTWNPIDGKCPKCGVKMTDTGDVYNAD